MFNKHKHTQRRRQLARARRPLHGARCTAPVKRRAFSTPKACDISSMFIGLSPDTECTPLGVQGRLGLLSTALVFFLICGDNTMLGFRFQRNSKQAAPTALQVGADAPDFTFTDINGQTARVSDYRDWIVVYTAADRESSDALMTWQRNAGLEMTERWPHLKVVYINIADVTIVPSLMRYVVEPVLKHISASAMGDLDGAYTDAGLTVDPDFFRMHLVPDWNGQHLQALGLANADKYSVFVAHQNKIKGVYTDNQNGSTAAFLDLFEDISELNPAN